MITSDDDLILFQQGDVLITPLIAKMGKQSYSITDLNSCRVENNIKRNPVLAIIALAVMLLVFLLDGDGIMPFIFFLLLLLLKELFFPHFADKSHVLKIMTKSGEIDGYQTESKKLIQKIKSALDKAVLYQ